MPENNLRNHIRKALNSWHTKTHTQVDAEGFATNCAAWNEMLACCLDNKHEDYEALIEHIASYLEEKEDGIHSMAGDRIVP